HLLALSFHGTSPPKGLSPSIVCRRFFMNFATRSSISDRGGALSGFLRVLLGDHRQPALYRFRPVTSWRDCPDLAPLNDDRPGGRAPLFHRHSRLLHDRS